jgi:prepilin-type N-terminal cleavage/methylation domain-containing protein
MTTVSFSAKSPLIMLTRLPRPSAATFAHRSRRQGFSLVEILVVLSIASILSVLATVGMQSVLGSAYSNETSDLANTLVRARAYAMANNTYVFVGIEEVDASKPTTGVQTAATAGHYGRIGVTVVASNDGTSNYATSNLTVVSPLRHFDNLDFMSATGVPIANLPNNSTTGVGATYNLASSSSASATTFNWPLSGTAQYSFGSSAGTVIQFDPQGEAQIITATNTTASQSILQWIEIDLVPTHGTSTAGPTSKNPATILIDGASGNVTTYRN